MTAMKRAVFITGGAKRVGAALARYFAGVGYDVALHYHRSAQEAAALKAEIEGLGAACVLVAHDLADVGGIAGLMGQVKAWMPHCVAMVNNASVFERAGLMETDEALFDRQFALNLKAPFFLTQAFVRAFGKGSVVNMLDTDVVSTQGSHFAYLLSKKALAEFTPMAARALGPDVRVNGVCPGIVLPSNELDAEYMAALAQKLPLRATATLEAVAMAVRSLIENESVTGQILFTAGGQHLL